MFWIFGAGGLVLDGADELFRVPLLLRVIGLVLCIYALGDAVGWSLQEVGGAFPWESDAQGFAADGRVHLDAAPYWVLVALCFRHVRHALDRVQAMLIATPERLNRHPTAYASNAAPVTQ